MNCDLEVLDHSHIITTTNFMLLHSDSLKNLKWVVFAYLDKSFLLSILKNFSQLNNMLPQY